MIVSNKTVKILIVQSDDMVYSTEQKIGDKYSLVCVERWEDKRKMVVFLVLVIAK